MTRVDAFLWVLGVMVAALVGPYIVAVIWAALEDARESWESRRG